MAVAAAAVAKVPLVCPGLLCASRAHLPPFLRASFNLKPTGSFLRSISSLPNSKFSIVHYHGSSPSLPPRRSGIEHPSDIPIRRSFSTIPSAHVSDAGSIGSPLMQSMENKIKEHLHAEVVTVRDAYGDGRHVSIDVVSSAFEGESAVNRQRMVYKAIWEELQSTVHAVDQMTTRTPTEAGASSPK